MEHCREIYSQLISLLQMSFRQVWKYKLRDLIWPIIILPVSYLLDIIFKGTYIQTVNFYETLVPYIYLMFLVVFSAEMFLDIVGTTFYDLIEIPNILFYCNKISWMLSKIFYWLIFEIIKIILVFSVLHILYALPIKYFIFSILIGIPMIIFSVAFSLLVSWAPLLLRRDASPLWWGISSIFYSILPISFALTIFPLPHRKYIEIFLPFYGIIEEMRKLALIQEFDLTILVLSIICSIVYLVIGLIVFRISWNYARKTGKIKLA